MDAPAMITRKHVPEDAGHRNIAAEEEGGQQQLHRDEKQHKPMMMKMKDKVKKIKSTITGHGHGNGGEHEHDRNSGGGSNSSDEDEEDAAQREAEVEKRGYQEDVEDKPVVSESGGPELHGAPMYDSERIPAAKEAKGNDDATGVRIGDLDGPIVEDPAAPRSTTPAPRGGEDIGTTDVVRNFEKMTVSDDPAQVGAGKMDVDEHREAMPVSDGTGEEWKDAPTDGAYGGTYTERLKNTAAGTTEYGKKLASTVYEKVTGAGTVVASKAPQVTPGFGARRNAQEDSSATATPESMTVGAGKRDLDEPREGMPVSNAGTEELKDAAPDAGASGATYTEKVKSAATGTTEYGKKLASMVYGKVTGAGAGTVVAGKSQQVTPGVGARGNPQTDSTAATPESMAVSGEPREGMPVSSAGTEGLKDTATDAATTEGASGATYTDKIRSAASTVYGKVAGAGAGTVVAGKAQQVAPGVGARGNPQTDSTPATTPESMAVSGEPREGMPVSSAGTEGLKDTATDAATRGGASGAAYTDKIRSAASTVYEKIAGVGTAGAGKVQQGTPSVVTGGTPGVGAQGTAPDDTTATATANPGAGGPGNGQGKGVTGVTGYITEMLRPGNEERSLSGAITGAVQQRKAGVGSTVAKAREAPAQAMTRAREAVTSLTGGSRVSETVQPTTEGNIKEGVAVEGPKLRGGEIGAAKTSTNIM